MEAKFKKLIIVSVFILLVLGVIIGFSLKSKKNNSHLDSNFSLNSSEDNLSVENLNNLDSGLADLDSLESDFLSLNVSLDLGI